VGFVQRDKDKYLKFNHDPSDIFTCFKQFCSMSTVIIDKLQAYLQ